MPLWTSTMNLVADTKLQTLKEKAYVKPISLNSVQTTLNPTSSILRNQNLDLLLIW